MLPPLMLDTMRRTAADGRRVPSRKRERATAEERAPGIVDAPLILVVDDDRANLRLAQIVLESEGFRVAVAVDAISALEVLKDREPALIVMDIQLPGMDGWELSRRLNRNAATAHIPIIAVTAYGTRGDDQRAREAGCAAYVAKPVSSRELPGIIRRYLPSDLT